MSEMKLDNLILRRKITIETWQLKATIAQAEKREEYLPILLRIKKNDGSNADDIAEHLLFEKKGRKVVAARLLTITAQLKLTEERDKHYYLTADGEKALTTRQIFIPYKGVYRISCSDDSLLPFQILDCKPEQEKDYARENVHGIKDKFDEMVSTGHLRKKIQHKQGMPCCGGLEIRIDDINLTGMKTHNHLDLTLEWHITKKQIRLLDDSKNGKMLRNDFPIPPEVTPDDVWQALLAGENLSDDWVDDARNLAVDFDNIDDTTRVRMCLDISFSAPTIRGYDNFAPCIVKSVPVNAQSDEDAEQWARWRLENYINDYATKAKFAEWQAKAELPFRDFDIASLTRNQLAEECWENDSTKPTKTWYLIAAKDWDL